MYEIGAPVAKNSSGTVIDWNPGFAFWFAQIKSASMAVIKRKIDIRSIVLIGPHCIPITRLNASDI
jgi:hypothetical protein